MNIIGKTIKSITKKYNFDWYSDGNSVSQVTEVIFTDGTKCYLVADNPTYDDSFYAEVTIVEDIQDFAKGNDGSLSEDVEE